MTRHLTKLLLAASALTVLAVAPAASAAPALQTKPYGVAKTSSVKITKVADRGDRSNRNRGNRTRGDRSRNRDRRGDRHRGRGYEGNYRNRNRSYQRDFRRRDYYRPARHSHSGRGFRNRGYYTPYRSNLGISFSFGSPGYSSYRWAPAAYSFYRPTYGSYGYYQRRTTCRRITVEGWHHGHRELVSVKECSNPWDGTYIVQGSERLLGCPW